jgi:hypothetical protein
VAGIRDLEGGGSNGERGRRRKKRKEEEEEEKVQPNRYVLKCVRFDGALLWSKDTLLSTMAQVGG